MDLNVPALSVDRSYRTRLAKNLAVDDRVRMHDTTDPELDGKMGTILGRSVKDYLSFYIVLLDVPHSRGDRAVNLPECCMDYDVMHMQAS